MTKHSDWFSYYQIVCECGSHTFEFIDVVSHDPEYGSELEETIRRCSVCKRIHQCIHEIGGEHSRKKIEGFRYP
jgi:hypothetical protein